jgi:hypothetical protein
MTTWEGQPEPAPPRAPRQRRSAPAEPRKTGKSIRYPEGSDLSDWLEAHAEATGTSVNALILLALEAFRAAVESDPPRASLEEETRSDA